MTLPTGWDFLLEENIPDLLLYAIFFENCYNLVANAIPGVVELTARRIEPWL